MKPQVFTVSSVNKYIKSLIEDDFILQELFISGEISNFTRHQSGHMYFTLKDEKAAISCIMFKTDAQLLKFAPENGLNVVVFGRLSIYEKTGQVSIHAQMLEPVGIGALSLSFEQLKDKLSKEGLFDVKYKKPLPPLPKTIAVITSPTGAVVRDIINVTKRRNKGVSLVVVPTSVQGDDACFEIAEAIKLVNDWNKADIIIVARGGGSMEDLWAFNEEVVARAIFASKIPVISAVGHETDYTICDFVADLRAPTPSAAAELAVPVAEDLQSKLLKLINRLDDLLEERLEIVNYVEHITKQLQKQIVYKIERNKLILANKIDLLQKMSPLNVLKRGFTIVYDEKNAAQTAANKILTGQNLTIKFHDGNVVATAINIEVNK